MLFFFVSITLPYPLSPSCLSLLPRKRVPWDGREPPVFMTILFLFMTPSRLPSPPFRLRTSLLAKVLWFSALSIFFPCSFQFGFKPFRSFCVPFPSYLPFLFHGTPLTRIYSDSATFLLFSFILYAARYRHFSPPPVFPSLFSATFFPEHHKVNRLSAS